MIFLWCNTATAESELPPCQGEDSMQWTNCYGSYNDRDITDYIKKNFPKMEELYPNTYYTRDYDGEFGSQPGLRNGHGISNLYLNDELYSTYEGEYFNDQRNGYGVYENIMKSVKYVGEYKDGKKNGQGTYTRDDGVKFVGEFKDGLANGQGTHTWPDGQKFVGEFKDGKRNGQGTFTWPDGEKYVGEYKDGKRNGQGTHTWPDREKYVGEYKDGKKNGQGTYTWPSGQKFVGEFKDGVENGQGTHTWPDGQKFVGEFKDGKRNGQGTHTWPNGDKEVAVYKDGEIVKIVSSNVKKESSGGSKTLTGYTYITMMDKGISANGIWGTRCNYSDGSYREIKSSDPGGPPPRC